MVSALRLACLVLCHDRFCEYFAAEDGFVGATDASQSTEASAVMDLHPSRILEELFADVY